MLKEKIPFGPLVILASVALTTPAAYSQSPAADCDDATGRCSVTTRLETENDGLFATVTLQIGRDGAQPVLMATVPLGIAARPGVRIVAQPASDAFLLAVDACFPDGCRVSAELQPDDLSRLLGAQALSLQFIAFTDGQTLAADLPAASLADPLRAAGVTLP